MKTNKIELVGSKTPIVLFAVLAAVLIFASVFSFYQINQFGKSAHDVSHTADVKYNLMEVLSTLKDAETGQRGFLLTNDSSFLEPYQDAQKNITRSFKYLDSMVNDNAPQLKNLQKLKSIASERLYMLKATMLLQNKPHNKAELTNAFVKSKGKMDEARKLVKAMLDEEDILLKQRTEKTQDYFELTPILSLSVSIVCILFIFIAFAQTRKENTLRLEANEMLQQKNDDLQQQKEFVDAVFDASADVMCVLNINLVFTKFNKAGTQFYNRSKEELLGHSFIQLYPHIQKTGLYQDLQKAVQGNIMHQPEYYSPIIKKYFELTMIPLKDRFEKVESILLVAHDISGIVEAKQQLQQQNRQLEDSNQELTSFSYIASHDLKEPLRKIQIFTKRIAEEETLSEKARDFFKRILASSERMQNLIDSLLSFSLANKEVQHYAMCSLHDILRDSIKYLEETIREKQAVIEFDTLPTVNGVPVQLQQLFTNLLDNAMKYGRTNVPPHIKISCEKVTGKMIDLEFADQQKQYYRLRFADNGIGFEQQFAKKIFEIFQRLHGKTEYSGTGIGLAICKKIVSNHKGFIVAEGTPGVGAVFSVYLPTE